MQIYLRKYTDEYKQKVIEQIAKFFGFHINLANSSGIEKIDYSIAEKNLPNWVNEESELYLIVAQDTVVGFLRIGYRGDNVAWIEDVFVEEEYRKQGIATESIQLAEKIIKERAGYDSVCIDVVPRNRAALSLYYKLGYDKLSILTVRKDLNPKNDNTTEIILGHKYKI